jgi:hypothetical protein
MRVQEVVTQILALSHQGGNDAALTAQALGWLNAAYRELMDELVPLAPPSLQTQAVVVTNSAGNGVLPDLPARVLQVFDRNTGAVVPQVTVAELAALDPMGMGSGPVARCVVQGTAVQVHPACEATLLVVMIPVAKDVLLDGDEASLALPAGQVHGLVWGALVWSSVFERGFATASELAQFRAQWQEAKARVKLAVLGQVGVPLRVQGYQLV